MKATLRHDRQDRDYAGPRATDHPGGGDPLLGAEGPTQSSAVAVTLYGELAAVIGLAEENGTMKILVGCGGTISTISYSDFGFRSNPRVNGCGGTSDSKKVLPRRGRPVIG